MQPSFVEYSICVQDPGSAAGQHSGWFLACRTLQDLLGLADSLCFAGCIMRDLAQHCALARSTADHLKEILSDTSSRYQLVPARPTSSRAGTRAAVIVVKVSTPHCKHKEAALLNEVQFLLTLQHIGIPRVYGIYDMKLKGRRALAMLTDVPLAGAPLSAWVPPHGLPEVAESGRRPSGAPS